MINPERKSIAPARAARLCPASPGTNRQTGASGLRSAPATAARINARAPEKKHFINIAMLTIIRIP